VMKSLAAWQPPGWTRTATVLETVHDGQGNLVSEKEKEFAWTVDEVDVTITTAAGSWDNAVKIRRIRNDKENWERVYWLVPGVGKVFEEGERREELIRFEVVPHDEGA
jgi:hypothetical protein